MSALSVPGADLAPHSPTKRLRRSLRKRARPSGKPSDSPAKDTPAPNPLLGLPTELLFSISDFLPPEDLICFSSSCPRLSAVLHCQVNRQPPPRGQENVKILRRLEQDLPNHFMCYVCYTVHQYDGLENFGHAGLVRDRENMTSLPCVRGYRWEGDWKIMKTHEQHVPTGWYQLKFIQAQLAMRRYHYGPQAGVSIESLFWTQVFEHANKLFKSDDEMLMLFSVEAQICPQPLGLYLRLQDMMLVDSHRLDLLGWPPRVYKGWLSEPLEIFNICCHVEFPKIGAMVNSLIERYSDTEKAPSTTYRCDECCTDSQIGICKFDSKLALVVTRWIYLGRCKKPTDRRWIIHSRASKDPKGPGIFNPGSLTPRQRVASVRTCYENASPRSFDEVQSCNFAYLKNQRFKEVMYHPRGTTWYLPFPKSQ